MAKMPDRVDIRCPRCGDTVNVGVTFEPTLTYTSGNGSKAFLTARVDVGGMEHTCSE